MARLPAQANYACHQFSNLKIDLSLEFLVQVVKLAVGSFWSRTNLCGTRAKDLLEVSDEKSLINSIDQSAKTLVSSIGNQDRKVCQNQSSYHITNNLKWRYNCSSPGISSLVEWVPRA